MGGNGAGRFGLRSQADTTDTRTFRYHSQSVPAGNILSPMDVFLSYASEERPLAERVCRVLETEGHDVFFDRDDLGGGDAFGARIRRAIASADVLVYLISQSSVASRSYALTELSVANTLPKRRRPAMLPVRVDDTPFEDLPAALRAYTVLEPRGDIPAEIANAVARLQTQKRTTQLVLGGITALGVGIAIAAYAVLRSIMVEAPLPDASAGAPIVGSAAPATGRDPVDALNDAILARTPPERRVTVTGMPTNDGWMAVLILADRTANKIYYRLDNETSFTDTGSTGTPNLMTGEPMPNTTIRLGGAFWRPRTIAVKYRDANGTEHGEYTLAFDPRAEFLRFTRQALASVAWVSFLETAPGKLSAYFTTLLSFKAAFSRIRYSIDSAALDHVYEFAVDSSQAWPARLDTEPIFISIPPSTRFITVEVEYVDGTTDKRRFDVSQ